MYPSPTSSPASPKTLSNSTNLPLHRAARKADTTVHKPFHSWLQLPTPPRQEKRVSSEIEADGPPNKRAKTVLESDEDSSDEEELWAERNRTRSRRRTYNTTWKSGGVSREPYSYNVTTQPILESFVSSIKSDLFKSESLEDDFLTVPYACAYSYAAKRGGTPLLAVSTEEGSVHIFNTSKRKDWDPEPPRTTLRPHTNGIFDVKWSPSDSLLATCSGDSSIRVTSLTSARVLHTLDAGMHSVKCASWHPSNEAQLSSGGRDGVIRVWDLRVARENKALVMAVPAAHDDLEPKVRRPKQAPKSVTNLIFQEDMSLISSGSSDGVLRCWDLRFLSEAKKRRPAKSKRILPSSYSPVDPTTANGSRRPRGILSLTAGTGPTSGLLFALAADSQIHTYSTTSLAALPIAFTHPNVNVNASFYIRSAVSPCGRWLACGGRNSAFLFDAAAAAKPCARALPGIELKAQVGEVNAIDWADGMLATCADDRTVRVWRPDVDVYRECQEDPEAQRWKWNWAVESDGI